MRSVHNHLAPCVRRLGRTDSIKFRKSHRKMKARQTRYINQIPSETQRFDCETSVTLTV